MGILTCDNYPRTLPEVASSPGIDSSTPVVFWYLNVISVLVLPVILLYLYRKLPTWGEPPLPDTAENEKEAAAKEDVAAAKNTVKDYLKTSVQDQAMALAKDSVKV